MYVGIYFRVFISLLPLGVIDANLCVKKELVINPARVVVKYEDSVEANCSALIPHDGMGWEATAGTNTFEEDVQVITWSVKNLTKWKVDVHCFINAEDHQCSSSLSVVVYKDLEHAPVLSVVNHTGPMTEGTTYQLQCAIYNVAPARHLDVMWYRGDEMIHRSQGDGHPVQPTPMNVTATFRITPSRHDNGAQFQCEAELMLGEGGPQPPPPKMASQNVSITVHYGPVTTNCPQTIEIPEGGSLAKFCPVEGNPLPTITWLRDGLPIDPSHPLSREDSGVYTVRVTGHLPFEDMTKEVFVMYGPVFHCPSIIIVEEHKTYNLSCKVEGYPTPDTQWLKDGEEVGFPEALSRGYGGQYVILANSTYGNASHLLDITILYPPSHIAELEDTEADVLGSDVALKCSSYGDPRPQYRWNYHKVKNVKVTTEDGVSLLHINGVTSANIGTYTCSAFNMLGEERRSVRVTVKGVQASCPIQFFSDGKSVVETVVEYKHGVSVKCSAPGQTEVLWTVSENNRIIGDTWTQKTLKDWDVKPICKAAFVGLDPCQKLFNVTLFKTPEDVSIRFQDHSGPVVKDKQYTLQCEIQNIAPVKNLVVNWYKKGINGSLKTETFRDNIIKTPQNISSMILINATKSENGAQYFCEATLELGTHGPRPVMSEPLNITVYYAPVISLPNVSVVPVFKDYQEVLVCEAEGNPKPEIIWIFNNKSSKGSNLTISTELEGWITCNASNGFATTSKTLRLVTKEDYLPLIAGFVAVIVVITSVIFVFFYSIYYTNTKMGHYSLKDAKPNTQNGDVARNGLDSSLPMKKLSQQNIYVMSASP